MFETMNIPRKMGTSFLAVTLSAAVMMLVFGVNILRISASAHSNEISQSIHADALELETALLRQNSQLRGFLVTADESYLKSYYEGRDAYDKTSAELEQRLTDPALRALVVASREATLAWRRDWGDKYVDVVKQGQRDAAQAAVRAAGKKVLVTDAVLPLRKLRDVQKATIASNSASQAQAITIAWIALGLGGMAMISLSVMLSRYLSRSIAVPITDLTATMKRMASGDNDVVVPELARSDELGDMARAVEVFREAAVARVHAVRDREQAMAEIGRRLHAVAQSDLTARLHDLPPAFRGVADDFNEAMAKLCDAMHSVQGSIAVINETSGEIRQASLDLSVRSEQQAASLQSSAAAMSDLTAKVMEYADIASGANRSMNEAQLEAEKGGEVVSRAIAAMQGVDQASMEISDIIALIDGIAFQTNLLALNAGVEAARAGDAGKGFAVVASEVRALAQRAADAASDIKARVSAVTTHVRSGAELVNETGEALHRIIERVKSVSEAIAAIAQTATQQSDGLSKVNGAIGAMDAMTQQNAAMVEETTAATQNLAREVQQLARAFASFRIGEGNVRQGRAGVSGQGHALDFGPAQVAVPRPAPAAPRPAPRLPARGNLAEQIDADWSEF